MRMIATILALSLLAGCADEPMAPREDLDLTGPVYRLNVSEINITHDYVPSRRPPNVDHLADLTPSDAIKNWVHERLQAAGAANTLEVDVKDGSIVRTDLPKQKSGIEGALTTEQTEQYDGTLEVEIKLYKPQSPLAVAHVDAIAHQRLTLSEDATTADRERLYHNMTVDLMRTLLPQLDDNLRRYFGVYMM